MVMKQAVGLIGVGLMGHGIARNVLKHGYKLTIMNHEGNRPLDELLTLGVATRATAAEVAREADVVILCVTGTKQVEDVVTSESGVLSGLKPGAVVVDCSTAIPGSTIRMAALVKASGGRFIDAPMTRTAQHAHEGRLNLLVGGAVETIEEVRPILSCFAENIDVVGAIGAGHKMKLLHNYVSIGFMTLLAEAAACAQRAEVSTKAFVDVLASGGGGGVALERLKPYILSKDASALQFFIANALKDINYYREMAQETNAAREIADAVAATYSGAVEAGVGQRMVPELVSFLAESGEANDR
jgi:3-hydroxyisobutyrate dehydrogenase-like beta-hydroxyacid dehydrogenase